MKKRMTALLLLCVFSAANLMAQTAVSPESDAETNNRPLWLRDLRRWEIVAFGSFPFTMFFATIGMDMYRWNREAGMDFGRREYAPWPITSGGGVRMTDEEQRRTIFIAIGLSAGVAIADHFLERGRRQRERRRAEAIPAGTIIITRTPSFEEEPEEPYYEEDLPDAENAEAALPYPP